MIDKITALIVIEMKNGEQYNYWHGAWKELFTHLQDIIAKFGDKEDTISLSREIDPKRETFLEKNDIKKIAIKIQ